ncbi:MAG: threo-3-hydroxy-L-aspartate ammonia-lyase [Fimbriimonadaceae bacterium]
MVTFEDIFAAHERIGPYIHRTPVQTSKTLDNRLGAEVFVKCENFQVTGSFKYRGATNAILQLSVEARRNGVLTFSSGNHAQALARAGQVHNVKVTVIMPENAPAIKKAATEGYGAEVILYKPDETSREALGREISESRGLTLVPPYDHPHVVAGQGTATKELFEEIGDLDQVYVCAGGGGLLSGSAIAANALAPHCKVFGVEPDAGDDICRSFRSGKLETVYNPDTIADGARTPSASELTFGIIKERVTDMLSVPDSVLLECMSFYAERMKMIVEPTGCLSLAGIWRNDRIIAGQRIGIIVSGGNVDLRELAGYWGSDETSC